MKIVLYKDENILNVIDGVNDVSIDDKDIVWSDGALRGVKAEYIIVNDDTVVGGSITNELLSLDLSDNYQTPPKIDEVAEMKKQQTDLIFELMLKGVL
ncbi:hypothetical protein [Bacillus marasmi]|uniref:hypothetical protein n=1 Tax=Bacillus marasmi TaxID=1926279 RepID=UPI0011CC4DAA|nr:hypothetical protein [Bacillus marasmi]